MEQPTLPDGWEWRVLGDVCNKPQYGWTTGGSKKGKLHLLRTTDITHGQINWNSVPYCTDEPSEIEKYLLREGDIVISRAGSVGFSMLITRPEPAVFASYLIRFTPLINTKYVSYFLQSPLYWQAITDMSAGIAIPNVNARKLKEIPFPLPPPDEQESIVARIEELFTQLDAGVTALKRVQAQLNRYKASVLKAYLNEGTKLSIHKEEWHFVKLDEVATVSIGGTPSRSKADYWNGDINWVSSGEVKNNRIQTTKEKISQLGLNKSNTKVNPTGTVLLAMIGEGKTRGQTAILDIEAATNQNIASIIPSPEKAIPEWIFYWLMSRYAETRKSASGGMQYALNSARIRDFIIPLPPLVSQTKIVAEFERRLTLVVNIEKLLDESLQRSGIIRRAFLKQAFEGKLKMNSTELITDLTGS